MSSQHHTELGPSFTPKQLQPALQYIENYWKRLEKFNPHDDGTLVGLPRPYFIPSVGNDTGFQFEEMYYWDSYFIAQGFLGTPRENLIKGLVENLMALQHRFRIIPNSGRMYHTSRSQPPFLTRFIMMVYGLEKNKRWLQQAMSVAKDEYRTVWMGTAHPNWRQVFHGLSRFYDINVLDDLAEAESGWDMNTRFDRKALSYVPVDLNALLYRYERDFEEAANILGDHDEAHEWSKRALSRRSAVMKYLWDEEKRCYFDYDFMSNKRSQIWSLAAFYPMWAGLDTKETAAGLMSNLDKFEFDGGLVTSAKKPQVATPIPAQWAYPNGWAPLQLIAIEGMERYGYHSAAERVARKWIGTNLLKFAETGEFLETYNVVDVEEEAGPGVYPHQVGFGWTNGVFIRLCQKYLKADEMPDMPASSPTVTPLQQLVRNPRQTLRRVGVKLNSAVPKRSS
jgi:alpha,alpha-trehalase